MSDTFAPDEHVARFEMTGGFFLYWPYNLIGGFFTFCAVMSALNPSLEMEPAQRAQGSLCSGSLGLLLLGIGRAKSWRRVKWIRTADKGGIQWYACGRVWHHTWDQLARIDTHTTIMVHPDGSEAPCDHRMVVTFTDGAQFHLRMIECDQYLVLFRYLEAKREQAAAARRGAHYVASLSDKQRAKNEEGTVFGPLAIHRSGVEWDGMYYTWDQIEGYEVQQGFLIIKSVDGDEFFRRTADLGDWRTALERLEAAAGKMAGRRKPPADDPANGPRKRA